jgi:hypothetical protein
LARCRPQHFWRRATLAPRFSRHQDLLILLVPRRTILQPRWGIRSISNRGCRGDLDQLPQSQNLQQHRRQTSRKVPRDVNSLAHRNPFVAPDARSDYLADYSQLGFCCSCGHCPLPPRYRTQLQRTHLRAMDQSQLPSLRRPGNPRSHPQHHHQLCPIAAPLGFPK